MTASEDQFGKTALRLQFTFWPLTGRVRTRSRQRLRRWPGHPRVPAEPAFSRAGGRLPLAGAAV